MRWPRVAQHGDESWMPEAACRLPENRGVDFFPESLHPPTGRPHLNRYTKLTATEEVRRAVAVCHTCPVEEACLEYAMRTKQESGVWGGLPEEERRSRARRRWWRDLQLQREEDGR